VPVCRGCGEQNPERARFCAFCGSALGAKPVVREARRTVTILFGDIVGSTALGERIDAETLRAVVTGTLDMARSVVERHGGVVERFAGDALMAVFGLPTAHDDDAMRAIRAADDMLSQLEDLSCEMEREWGVSVQLRVGVNTGEVATGDPWADEIFVTGDAVNVAARLEQAASPMEVVIGGLTHDLTERAVETEAMQPLSLKGKEEPVRAYRFRRIRRVSNEIRHTRMVGREREMESLREQFDTVVAERRCALATVIGPPGIGKSRLVAEFLGSLPPETAVMRCACLAYHGEDSYQPLAQAVADFTGVDGADPAAVREHILSLLADAPDGRRVGAALSGAMGLIPEAIPPQQVNWAFRRFLETVSAQIPVAVFVDDLQWAEPLLSDLLLHLVDHARSSGILLLAAARPELAKGQPELIRRGVKAVKLAPLDADACRQAANDLLDGAADDEVLGRVCELAGGSPLFVQAIVASLVRDRRIVKTAGTWTAADDLGVIAAPASIQSILCAHLDSLDSRMCDALERASIIGEVFYLDALLTITPEPTRPHLVGALAALVEEGLIEFTPTDLPGHEAYRFHHNMVREVAEQRLRLSDRAYLHERLAGWIESQAHDTRTRDLMIGYHLEQAFLSLSRLGPIDERGAEIGRRAAMVLGAAAAGAWDRGDDRAATRDFARAAVLLPADSGDRARLLLDASKAAVQTDLCAAIEYASEGKRIAGAHAETALVALAATAEADARVSSGTGSGDLRRCLQAATRAVEQLEKDGTSRDLCYALSISAFAEETLGLVGDSMDHAERVCEISRERHLAREGMHGQLMAAGHFLSGRRSVAQCIARARRALVECGDDLLAGAMLGAVLSRHLARAGEAVEARACLDRAISLADELGSEPMQLAVAQQRAGIEACLGDWAAAECSARSNLESLTRLGASAASNTAAELARVLVTTRQESEALEVAGLAEEVTDPDDLFPTAMAQGVRALVHARRGDHDNATREFEAVKSRLRVADMPEVLADVLCWESEAMSLAGRRTEALAVLSEATAIYDRLGVTVSAVRCRETAASL